jgi:hypothetical protein
MSVSLISSFSILLLQPGVCLMMASWLFPVVGVVVGTAVGETGGAGAQRFNPATQRVFASSGVAHTQIKSPQSLS